MRLYNKVAIIPCVCPAIDPVITAFSSLLRTAVKGSGLPSHGSLGLSNRPHFSAIALVNCRSLSETIRVTYCIRRKYKGIG